MPTGPDKDWLRVVHSAAGAFIQHNRCLIKDQLISPNTQFPGFALIIGNSHKDEALRYLFPQNRVISGRPCIQLGLDNRTIFCDHPFFFADCDLHFTPMEADQPNQYTEIPIPWAAPADDCILDVLISRVLLLFVDVVCIFADDVGGLGAVQAALSEWAALGRNASNLDHQPRVLIIMEPENPSVTHQALDEVDFLFELLQNPDVPEVFTKPNIICLPSSTLSGVSRYQSLKDELLKALDLSRNHRREDGFLLSAVHLDSFLALSLQHACQKPLRQFEFVSRPDASQAKNHASHLTTFLRQTDQHEWKDQAAFIASTILVDAYPPGVHRTSSFFSLAAAD